MELEWDPRQTGFPTTMYHIMAFGVRQTQTQVPAP